MNCTCSAPAKAILLGEHAVVHGQPAIAAPLSRLRTYVDARPSAHPLSISFANADRASFFWCQDDPNSSDPLARAIDLTARYFAVNAIHGELVVRSDIPIASGLGSGAAVSAALARGVAALLGRKLPRKRLNAIVYEVEKLHHGTPSGIDNTVIVYERPVHFVKNGSIDFIEFSKPIELVVADTGLRYPTRDAVAAVSSLLQRRPRQTRTLIDSIGALVGLARSCIETGDNAQLGKLMTQNHELLRALDVSSAALDSLVEAAQRGGALGAKLSGGGRGGHMIALAPRDAVLSVKQALLRAGANRVIVSSLGGKPTSA